MGIDEARRHHASAASMTVRAPSVSADLGDLATAMAMSP